jgi:hypothetical protein
VSGFGNKLSFVPSRYELCTLRPVNIPRKFFSRNCAPTIYVHLCLTGVFVVAITLVVCVFVCKRARTCVRVPFLRSRRVKH